jgi:predicted nucleotidyltransferase
MRKEAKEVMEVVKEFSPRLVGSVWRGTAHRNSDIDIIVFSEDQIQVLSQLQKHSFKVARSELISVTKKGRKESSFHIHVLFRSEDEADVVVRSLSSLGKQEKCGTYGDVKTGLGLLQLTKVLKENPLQKFIPT